MGSFGKHFTWWSVLSALCALSFATVGCGGGDDDDATGDGDADGDVDGDADGDADEDNPNDGMEMVFVADSLGIACGGTGACAQAGEPAEGFDLDRHTTTDRDDPVGCGKADGPGGIDNQLSPLVQAIVEGMSLEQDPNALLAENIQDGSLILLSRLLDVDDGTNDPLVPLNFYIGEDADADPANNLGGSGEFTVNPSSLDGPTIDDSLIHFDHGRLSGGMFDTDPSLFQVTVPIDSQGLVLDLRVEEAQIKFHYAEEGLTEGIVGGYVSTEAILTALQNLDLGDVEIPVPLVRSVLAAQADIDATPAGPTDTVCTDETVGDDCEPGQQCLNGFCQEPEGRCDALSLALRFTSVPASITGVTAAQ